MGYVGLTVQVGGLAETVTAEAVAEKVRAALDSLFVGLLLHNVDVTVEEHAGVICPECDGRRLAGEELLHEGLQP